MELLDIYDNFGNTTGKTIIRKDKNTKLNDNEHIAVAVIFIENDEGKFLMQKTSSEKGGEFSSTGGHVNKNETPLETIKREVKEELGISIDNEKIIDYGYIIYDMPIRFMFYLKKNVDIKDITVQQEEVDYVKYMTKEEIQNLINNNLITKSHGIIFNKILELKNKN